MYELMQQMTDTTHRMVGLTHELQEITQELRDHIADFDDFFRPIRNYFYWEQHCFNIPVCQAIRSIFDALDGVDELNDKMQDLVANLDQLDVLLPQILALLPPMIETMESSRTMMLTMHSTMIRHVRRDGGVEPRTRQPWGRPSTLPRTTTLSICRQTF